MTRFCRKLIDLNKNNLKTTAAVLLIDPFVSGNYTIRRFQEEGFKVIVLTTTKDFRKGKSLLTNADYHLTGGKPSAVKIGEIAQLLKRNQLQLFEIIPGYEGTLSEAERIRSTLFPTDSNNPTNTF